MLLPTVLLPPVNTLRKSILPAQPRTPPGPLHPKATDLTARFPGLSLQAADLLLPLFLATLLLHS
jgi:hypothetical protein